MAKRFQHGVLLCNKPTGITSNRVLTKVKRALGQKKAGHTGSLDPLATGVLPLCFGEATKFSQFGLESVKCYRVTARFGVMTDTGDCDGQVVGMKAKPAGLTDAQVRDVIHSFIGLQQQTPHPYSAVKYQGKPLYEYARNGITVPTASRLICISDIVIERLDIEQSIVQMWVCCSKGTYIRSLMQDIGEAINWGAHVVALHRTHAGYFKDSVCRELDFTDDRDPTKAELLCDPGLLPLSSLLLSIPWWYIDGEAAKPLLVGHAVERNQAQDAEFLKAHFLQFYRRRGVHFQTLEHSCLMQEYNQQVRVQAHGLDHRDYVVLFTPRTDKPDKALDLSALHEDDNLGSILMLRGIVELKETQIQPRRMLTNKLIII